MTDQPLWQTLGKPYASGRLVKWSVELGEFDIEYRPRIAIKGQAVANFVTELTTSASQEKTAKPKPWEIYVNGPSNREVGGVGVVIEILEEEQIEFGIKLEYSPMNNEAKYEAPIAGLLTTELLGGKHSSVHSDPQLVIGQVTGNFKARVERMASYLKHVLEIKEGIETFEIQHIP